MASILTKFLTLTFRQPTVFFGIHSSDAIKLTSVFGALVQAAPLILTFPAIDVVGMVFPSFSIMSMVFGVLDKLTKEESHYLPMSLNLKPKRTVPFGKFNESPLDLFQEHPISPFLNTKGPVL